MTTRAKFGAAVAVATVLAIAFGYFGLKAEMERIRPRPGAKTEHCAALVREARTLADATHEAHARNNDACTAAETADRALRTMLEAHQACTGQVVNVPLIATERSIRRMQELQVEMARVCAAGDGSSG